MTAAAVQAVQLAPNIQVVCTRGKLYTIHICCGVTVDRQGLVSLIDHHMALLAWQLLLGFVTTFDQLKYFTRGCCANELKTALSVRGGLRCQIEDSVQGAVLRRDAQMRCQSNPCAMASSSYFILQYKTPSACPRSGKIRQMLPVL